MKYHVTFDGKTAACGAVANRPDTFVYSQRGFEQHYAKNMACKRCKKILKGRAKKGRA